MCWTTPHRRPPKATGDACTPCDCSVPSAPWPGRAVDPGNTPEVWRELIAGLSTECTFAEPASDRAVTEAEATLGGPLPEPLAELLRETNGVEGDYGLGLVWPLERIVTDNLLFRSSLEFRDLYMPFDPLLFFADAGNGDQFAFLWTPRRDEVFCWDHETDSRRWVAPSLDRYLRWWLDGTIKL